MTAELNEMVQYLDEIRSPLIKEINRALCMGARNEGLLKGVNLFSIFNSTSLTKTDASTIRSPSAPFTRKFSSTKPDLELEEGEIPSIEAIPRI